MDKQWTMDDAEADQTIRDVSEEVLVRLSREFPSSTTQSSGRKRRFSTSDDSVKNGKKRARRVQRIVSSSDDDDDCMDDSYADEVIKNVSSDILNEETLFSPSVNFYG